jgi:hypothetical protein
MSRADGNVVNKKPTISNRRPFLSTLEEQTNNGNVFVWSCFEEAGRRKWCP